MIVHYKYKVTYLKKFNNPMKLPYVQVGDGKLKRVNGKAYFDPLQYENLFNDHAKAKAHYDRLKERKMVGYVRLSEGDFESEETSIYF